MNYSEAKAGCLIYLIIQAYLENVINIMDEGKRVWDLKL